MGLSSPGRVVGVGVDGVAVVDVDGVRRRVRLVLLRAAGIDVADGDWVLVQFDLAVAWLDEDEAGQLVQLLADLPAARAHRPAPAYHRQAA